MHTLGDGKTIRESHLEQIIRVMQLNQMVGIQMENQWSGNMGQWYYDPDLELIYVNPVMMMTLGVNIEDIKSSYDLESFLNYVHEEDKAVLIEQFEEHLADRSPVIECTLRLNHISKAIHHFYISGRSLQDTSGTTFIVGEAYDVTKQYLSKKELKKRQSTLVISDTRDQLTGLLNKDMIEKQLQKSITLARAGQESFCLLLLDLDFFKNINIHFGRDNGDIVLRDVADIFLKETRHSDFIGRVKGDQFQVILTGVDFKTGKLVAERIRKAIANHMFVNGIRITVSGGLVSFKKHSYDHIKEEALVLLKKSKKSGHNRMSY